MRKSNFIPFVLPLQASILLWAHVLSWCFGNLGALGTSDFGPLFTGLLLFELELLPGQSTHSETMGTKHQFTYSP